eukprot:2786296-Amphidinium_carterae.1
MSKVNDVDTKIQQALNIHVGIAQSAIDSEQVFLACVCMRARGGSLDDMYRHRRGRQAFRGRAAGGDEAKRSQPRRAHFRAGTTRLATHFTHVYSLR